MKKGSKVYIEGSLRTRKWQGQDGQDRYTTEIVAREMQMLDSRGQSGGFQTDNYNQQADSAAPAPAPQAPTPAPQAPASGFDDFDDDIPF